MFCLRQEEEEVEEVRRRPNPRLPTCASTGVVRSAVQHYPFYVSLFFTPYIEIDIIYVHFLSPQFCIFFKMIVIFYVYIPFFVESI